MLGFGINGIIRIVDFFFFLFFFFLGGGEGGNYVICNSISILLLVSDVTIVNSVSNVLV